MSIKFKKLMESVNALRKDHESKYSEDSEFPTAYRNRIYGFYGSIHTKARAKERHPELKNSDWKDFHNKVENHLNSLKRTEKKDGYHLFYSKSKDFGYIASVNHEKRKVHVISILPKKRENIIPGTEKVIVESIVEFE